FDTSGFTQPEFLKVLSELLLAQALCNLQRTHVGRLTKDTRGGVRLHPVLPSIGNINSCDIDGAWNLVDFLRRGHTFFNRGRSSNYLRDRTWLIRVRNGTVFKVLAFFKLGFNILIRIDGSGISHR